MSDLHTSPRGVTNQNTNMAKIMFVGEQVVYETYTLQ
jgi:hypothetical protein